MLECKEAQSHAAEDVERYGFPARALNQNLVRNVKRRTQQGEAMTFQIGIKAAGLALVLASLSSGVQAAETLEALSGTWVVDLRPSFEAPAYDKDMVLAVGAKGALTGSFYDSAIESGQAGANKGKTCFAFTTSDGQSPYHTSGCLLGATIEGQTWSTGRHFLLTWTARRKPG